MQNLAKLVNARLPNGARVNFCRLPQADGVMRTGITFQLGSMLPKLRPDDQLSDSIKFIHVERSGPEVDLPGSLGRLLLGTQGDRASI
jgi:hypothetical protein